MADPRWLFFIGIFLLGMPLDGVIPKPVGLFHETMQDARYAAAVGRTLLVGVIWSAIYILAAASIVGRIREAVAIWSRHLWLSLMIFLMAISACWTLQPVRALVDSVQILGSGLFALAVALCYFRRVDDFLYDAAIALGLNQLVNIGMVILAPDLTMHDDGRWAGVTGSANFLGILAATTMWSAICAIAGASTLRRVWLVMVACVALTNLVMSGSVTASIFALAVLTMWRIAAWLLASRKTGAVRLLLLVIAAACIATLALTIGVTMLWENFTSAVGKDVNLSGRTAIWLGGISAFLARPWLGHGFGSDTQSLGVTYWATTFHSGYLEVAVKGGLIGLFVLMLMMLSMLRESWSAFNRRDAMLAAPIAFVVAAFVYNLSETAWLAARNPAWVFFLAGAFVLSARHIHGQASGARLGILVDAPGGDPGA